VVDCFLYIWGVNFGNAGSNNDNNILDKSNIVQSIWNGSFNLKCQQYTILNTVRDYMYFLVDGIYPKWSIFMNTYSNASTEDEKRYSHQQESCRKDVERVFAVLGSKFQILQRSFRLHDIKEINNIVLSCIILHNMTVEQRLLNEGEHLLNNIVEEYENNEVTSTIFPNETQLQDFNVQQYVARRITIMSENVVDKDKHFELKNDLTAHMKNNKNIISFYKPGKM
jgi:Plant transposon protein